MTDTATTTPAPDPNPNPADGTGTTVTAAEAMIPKSVYDREVQDRIKERNLYKPYKQRFEQMGENERQALLDLADAVAAGDRDAIVEWSAGTIKNLTGKDIADQIAARQAAETTAQATGMQPPAPTPTAPTQPALDPTAVRSLAREEFQRAQQVAELKSTLSTAGFEPQSPEAYAIVRMARDQDLPIGEAIAKYQQAIIERAARLQGAQVAAAQAAGQTPAPAPDGAPANSAPSNMSPRERALARLAGMQK